MKRFGDVKSTCVRKQVLKDVGCKIILENINKDDDLMSKELHFSAPNRYISKTH